MKSKSKLPLSLLLELSKVLARVNNTKKFKQLLSVYLELPKKCSSLEEFRKLESEFLISAKEVLSSNDFQCLVDFAFLVAQHCENLLKTKS